MHRSIYRVLLFVFGSVSSTSLPVTAETTGDAHGATVIVAGFDQQVVTLPSGGTMTVHRRPGNGPSLVLLPGTWGDVQSFTPLIEQLPVSMPVVVVELCWQGGQTPPTLDLSIERIADDVVWLISKLRLEKFYLGGHSIGGMITVEIAGRDVPGLVGAIPIEGWTHHSVVDTAFQGVVVGQLNPSQQWQLQTNRTRGQQHLSPQQRTAIAAIWRRWNGMDCLERSRVPILHVWGDRNQPHASRAALQIPDRPSIEIAWIAGASHSLMLEAPEALAKAVMNFVNRTTP